MSPGLPEGDSEVEAMKKVEKKRRRSLLSAALVVALAAVLLSVTTASALDSDDYVWIQQNPVTTAGGVYAVDAAGAGNVWAVGPRGAIYHYNGSNLVRQKSGTTYNLYAVAALDAGNVWAVGEAGTILHYDGSTWTRQTSGLAYDLTGVSAADSTHVWAVGDRDGFTNGTMLFYNGSSWSVQKSYEVGGTFDVSAYDATHAWAVNIRTYFYDGSDWSVVNDGDTWMPYVVSAADASNLWALDWDGTVLRSGDGGRNWSGEYIGDWPANICAVDAQRAWVAGWDGRISYYDGSAWVDQATDSTDDFYDVCQAAPGEVYAVGGTQFFKKDTTTSWATTPSGTTNSLRDLGSAGADEVWAVGDGGTVRYSSDGGDTWGAQVLPTAAAVYSISVIDSAGAWAVGWNAAESRGEVFSYDGSSWTLHSTAGGLSINGVAATAADRVWVVAANGGIFFWDGGSWAGQGTADEPLNRVKALDSSNLWAVGNNGRIVYTTDGSTWYYQASGTTANLNDLSVASTTSVWAVGWNGAQSSGELIRYDGSSWSLHSSLPGSSVNGVTAVTDNRLWVAAADGGIYYWDGSGWAGQGTSTSALNAIHAHDANNAWAAGDSGAILKFSGHAWSQIPAGGTRSNLKGVSALSQDAVWAAGARVPGDGTGGDIQSTTDGGGVWARQTTTAAELNDVDMFNSSFGFAVGWDPTLSRGQAFRYNGSTWSSNWTLSGWRLNGVSIAATNSTWVVASSATQGRIYRRVSSWSNRHTADRPLNGVFALSTSNVWAVGNDGRIRRTTNGNSFSAQASPTTNHLYGVTATATNNAWAVGAGGTILQFNGTSWSVHPQSGVITGQDLYSVSATDASHVWAVGANGTVIFFDGTQWNVQESGTTEHLRGVDAFDSTNAWAVGDNGIIVFADPPYIKYCYPTRGDPGQTLKVQVSGAFTNFRNGQSALDMGEGIAVVPGSVQVWDPTVLVADIVIDPLAAHGPRDVNVVTGDEVPVALAGGFVVGPEPAVTGVSPAVVPPGYEGRVTVSGRQTGFDLDSEALFGDGVTADFLSEVDPAQVTAHLSVDPGARGARDVNVITGTETPAPLEGGFLVAAAPGLSSVSPSSGREGTVVTLSGSEFLEQRENVGVTSEVRFGGVPAAGYLSWSDNTVRCTVPSGVSGEVEVSVETAAGTSGAKTFDVTSPPAGASTWYLAEGSNAWGFSTDIAVMNPNNREVTVRPTFMTPGGPLVKPDIKLPASSSRFISPGNEYDLYSDFSTKIECLEGETIAVDRTMYWAGGPESRPEGHTSVGVTAPANEWYFAEGSSAWGFESWLAVQNPSGTEATCELTYMIEGADPVTVSKKVPPNSRRAFSMADDIGARDASVKVTSDVGVIPERSMYRDGRRQGNCSIGATAPANDFYLAEGTTAWGFTTYVLVQNPNPEPADVTVTHMTPSGAGAAPAITVPANSRTTLRLNDTMPGTDLSTRVSGSLPIVAERAMYWDTGTGEAGHSSIGVSAPRSKFFLPGGQSGRGFEAFFETWTLVQNPDDAPVEVRVTYLSWDGKSNKQFTRTMAPNSRQTFLMADSIDNTRAGVVVECLTPGRGVVAERTTYWDTMPGGRSAGANTVGAYAE